MRNPIDMVISYAIEYVNNDKVKYPGNTMIS
jgi:hypothetical protein